jgi:hypothetical protein
MPNGAVERADVGCAEEAFAALGAFPTLSAGLLGVLDGVGTDTAAARTGWRHGFTVGRSVGLRGVLSRPCDLRVIVAVCGSVTAAHRLGPKSGRRSTGSRLQARVRAHLDVSPQFRSRDASQA